jgi:HK97 gp10 family phage protein
VRVTRRVRLEDLTHELETLPSKIGGAAQAALQMPYMVEAAKSFCPVDTGALMASIRVEAKGPLSSSLVAGGGGYINPKTLRPVDYARRVHDGTSHVPARPFMQQAVIAERHSLVSEVFMRTAEVA